jgi:PST family polysaccharide transporter
VGYYTSAQRLIIIAQSVLTMPIALAFYPYIGKAFANSRAEGLAVAQKLVALIVIGMGVASLIMFILGPFVINAFYGHQFQAAIPVFQILTVVPLLFALNNVMGIQIMLNLGMDKYFFKITAVAGILSVLLNLLMIRKWGYIGSTLNWLFTEVFLLVSMYVVLRYKSLNPLNAKYFRPFAIRELLTHISRR